MKEKKSKKGEKDPILSWFPPPKCKIFFKRDLPLVHNTIYIQALWELLASWIIGLSDLKHYKSSIVCNNGYWTTSDQGLSYNLNFKKSKNIGNSVWTNSSNYSNTIWHFDLLHTWHNWFQSSLFIQLVSGDFEVVLRVLV